MSDNGWISYVCRAPLIFLKTNLGSRTSPCCIQNRVVLNRYIYGEAVYLALHLWVFSITIMNSCHMVYMKRVMDPAMQVCPYLVIWCTLPLTFGPQIFRNVYHFPNKSFWLTKEPIWYIWMDLWLQTRIFAHICGNLDLWTSYFQKFLKLPQQVLTNIPTWHTKMERWLQTAILPIFGHLVLLMYWLMDLKIFRNA